MQTESRTGERKLSASEVVRNELEADIGSGALMPGDSLDEDALAVRFGVSRTPVREALLQLSVRGLVTIAPRSGIYVARLSIPELMGLVELLAELEGSCAKLATRRLTQEEIGALHRVHEQSRVFEDPPDAAGYSHANAEFHEILYRACRNPALASEIAYIRRRIQVYRRTVFQNTARLRRSREEHAGILAAMTAGDALAAGQLMIEHIGIGGRDLADFLTTVPPHLLASEADYPGRRSLEDRRTAAVQAMAAKPAKPAPRPRLRRNADAR
ncbi:MAG TPA: GntR family transcriptional regulator [Burkholderiaceae bacterium]|nr:GntR family transcriptional regulator [Burkholderiaceae bacterium]